MNRGGGINGGQAQQDARRDQWLKSVQERVTSTLQSALNPESSLATLTKAVDTVHEIANHNIGMIEENAEAMRRKGNLLPQIACKAGCDICCHIRVMASVPEVLRIAEYVREHFSENEQDLLGKRIDANVAALNSLTPPERLNKMILCPLIVDHKCSIHPIRPVPCRAHHSTDVEVCKKGFQHPDKVQIPHFLDVDTVIAPVINGLRRAVRNSKLQDPGFIDLTRGLQIALKDARAREKWLNGEDIFAPAVDHDLKKIESDELRRRQFKVKF